MEARDISKLVWRDHGDSEPQDPEDIRKAKLLGMENGYYLCPLEEAKELIGESGDDAAMEWAQSELTKASNEFAVNHWIEVIKNLQKMKED